MGLKQRHILFMALGGSVGAGLFLGSGGAIRQAGTSVLLAYLLCGVVVFLIGRAAAELALSDPEGRTLNAFVGRYVGARMEFMVGWSYWLIWTLVCISEITAAGIFVRYWVPGVPQWAVAAMLGAVLLAVGSRAVATFGEMEFWLALVKIWAIVALLGCGLVTILGHVGPAGPRASFGHLWDAGVMLPHGMAGFAAILPVALFAFGGTEIIALTAAETDNAVRVLPRVINGIVGRILVFYIGSLAVIMAIVPWGEVDSAHSPFVLAFRHMGLPMAAGAINAVMALAALSACNAGLYATSRTLASLAESGMASARLRERSAAGVPAMAFAASFLTMLAGVALNYFLPDRLFGYAIQGVAFLLIFVWVSIMAAHLAYRRGVDGTRGLVAALPGAPVSNWLAIVFLLAIGLDIVWGGRLYVPFVLDAVWLAGLALLHGRLSALRAGASVV
ncbi:amino acid permease [Gluconacetobacter sacchari]|uniref:Amino acid permease n=1 Tax=Gluconacetobacter sacchari TaxID=92759 RepID=A0A7W4NLC7_9PROT|nr:amino acid permease [Gluconacetobacter sacchari]MBB2159867.1 amino acid permease [Gluconacetobacter sacchari]